MFFEKAFQNLCWGLPDFEGLALLIYYPLGAVKLMIAGILLMFAPHHVWRFIEINESKLEGNWIAPGQLLTGKIGASLFGLGLSLLVCLKFGHAACKRWSRMVHFPLLAGLTWIAHKSGEERLCWMGVSCMIHAFYFGFASTKVSDLRPTRVRSMPQQFWFYTCCIYQWMAVLVFAKVMKPFWASKMLQVDDFWWQVYALCLFSVCSACLCAIMQSARALCSWNQFQTAFFAMLIANDLARSNLNDEMHRIELAIHATFLFVCVYFGYLAKFVRKWSEADDESIETVDSKEAVVAA